MYKKTLLAATLLALSGTALAASSGFYGGISVGRDTGAMNNDEDSTLNLQNGTVVTNDHSIYTQHLSDYIVQAQLGYDRLLTKHFSLGAEAFANRSDADFEWNSNLATTQRDFQKRASYGFSVLPGWQINNVNRLYVRLSYINTKFDHESGNPGLFGPNFENHETPGTQIGFGWLYNVTDHTALRVEYDHTNYYNIKTTNSNLRVDNATTADGNFDYKSTFNQFMLGVNYYFDPTVTNAKNYAVTTLKTNGFYIAVDGSRNNTNLNFNRTTTTTNIKFNPALTGYSMGLHVGYGFDITHKINLAVDLLAENNATKLNFTRDTTGRNGNIPIGDTFEKYTIYENHSLAASLVPGFKLDPSNLVYVRLGYMDSKFEKEGDESLGEGPVFNTHRQGLQVGLGYQVALTENLGLFAEYDNTKYNTIKKTSDAGNTYTYKPHDDQYKLGLSYHF